MFLNWPRNKAALSYPVPPAPATAVLVPWFRTSGRVRVYGTGWDPRVAGFKPAAIAATWSQLEALLNERIPSLSHALIVLAQSPSELLSEARRDRLWRSFRVPIFEQIVSTNGELLAAECEAHHGCHIESPALTYDLSHITTEPCGCGRTTPRINAPERRLRSIAAYAR